METTVPERGIAAGLVEKLFRTRMNEYREFLERGDPEKAIPVIADTIRAFRALPPADREAFLAFLVVPLFDAASTVLAAMDGAGGEELEVTLRGRHVYLQEHFIGLTEEQGYLQAFRKGRGNAV